MVYAPASMQPPLDRKREDLKDEERVLYDFFTSESTVDKLVSFLSLEENKERDSFNNRRYWMFKVGLFTYYFIFYFYVFISLLFFLLKTSSKIYLQVVFIYYFISFLFLFIYLLLLFFFFSLRIRSKVT